MNDLHKQLRALQKKANHYDAMVERLDTLTDQLQTAINVMQDSLKAFSPTINTGRGNYRRYDAEIAETLEKLRAGARIARKTLQATYELTTNQLSSFCQKLEKTPGIDKTRDGVEVYYFARVSA